MSNRNHNTRSNALHLDHAIQKTSVLITQKYYSTQKLSEVAASN